MFSIKTLNDTNRHSLAIKTTNLAETESYMIDVITNDIPQAILSSTENHFKLKVVNFDDLNSELIKDALVFPVDLESISYMGDTVKCYYTSSHRTTQNDLLPSLQLTASIQYDSIEAMQADDPHVIITLRTGKPPVENYKGAVALDGITTFNSNLPNRQSSDNQSTQARTQSFSGSMGTTVLGTADLSPEQHQRYEQTHSRTMVNENSNSGLITPDANIRETMEREDTRERIDS